MKFTPEVVAALEVLRAAAENDFERHRLDVLERDLTAPPTVEIVDEKHPRFNGFTFSTDYKNHYRLNVNLHRLVWTYYYGEIPDEYTIHHVDENKANNDISNLQCLSRAEHNRIHLEERRPTMQPKIKVFKCEFCGKEFETLSTGSNKFCSVSCRNKNERAKRRELRTCKICGATFEVYKHDKTVTCSRKCAAQLMRQTRFQKIKASSCRVIYHH